MVRLPLGSSQKPGPKAGVISSQLWCAPSSCLVVCEGEGGLEVPLQEGHQIPSDSEKSCLKARSHQWQVTV